MEPGSITNTGAGTSSLVLGHKGDLVAVLDLDLGDLPLHGDQLRVEEKRSENRSDPVLTQTFPTVASWFDAVTR